MAKPKVGQIAASKPRFEEVNGDGYVFQGVNFYDDTPVPVAEPTPAVRTWGEAATDMGAGVLKGALGVAQLGARVGDALTYRQGDENPAIRFLNEYGEAVDMQKSEKLRGEEQKAQQAIVAAGQSAKERYGDGLGGKVARFGAEFGTGAYEAVSNPTLLANSLAEQIPMMGTMKAGQKAAELLARGATKVAPGAMATSVGKRIAGNAGLGGAVATGMALQGSDIKGDTYRRMMELPLDMWRQNPEFVTLAKSIGEDAAKIEIAKRESSTAGWQSAGASLATSLLPGGTAMERALVGGKKIPLKAVPQSVAGEFTQESGEEGLGQLASNNAVAKINVKQDRMEGVGGAAGQGGAVGGILGGGTTLARVGLQNYADKPTTPAVDPAIAAAAAKAAQQEAARKAAVSAVHTAAATPNSPIARAAAAANPLTPEEAWAKAQELDAQAALDEANGVAPVDPDTVPAAVPSGDPIDDTQKLIDASLAQAEQDKAAQRAAMVQPVVPVQQAGETQAPTVKDSLQVQAEPSAQPVTAPNPQHQEQFPPAQAGDILNLQGKPFNTMAGAMLKLKRMGGGHEIVRVDGGLVIRPKAAESVAAPAQAATENVANDQYQTDDERLASKRAAWQALKSTGAPDDVVASSVQGYQQKANAIGKPMVLWRHPTSGTLGFVPQGQKTPFAGGEVVATIHPDAPESVIAAQVSAQSKSNPLAGQPIDKDWTAFHPESGTLNVPRADMPQIKAEHRGAMVNFLNARGISSTQEEVPTESLKPTQAEYSPEKVEKAKGFKAGDRSILVSSDGHVLDGHHQWVAKHEAGEPVKVIRLDAPIDALLSAVREFPSAETTVNSTTQEKANEKAPKTEQDSAKPEAATGAEPVNAAESDQPAAEPTGASPSEVDLTTVEGVARAVQLKVASNRRKSREKSRKEREAKGYAPNSTPESEQADYEDEISKPPTEMQKQSAVAMLGADPLPLIRMFVNGNFEASEDVFKALTGVKIRGLSAAAKKAALYQWAKWTPEQIAQAEGDAQARKDEAAEKNRQDDLKSAVMDTWLGLDRLKVKEKDGTESTGQEFVLKSVASGFDKAHAQKKGAATVYGLTDGARFISLKAKPFTEFVKAAIAYGGLDKALAYVNPPKPQAPEGFVDRSIETANSNKADAKAKREFKTDELLSASDLLPYYEQEIQGVDKGVIVPNPRFELGTISEATAKEVAIYIDGYTGEQRRLRVSGRTIKHIEEMRPGIAKEIVEQLPSMFISPDEVLPDHKHPHKRALLVKNGPQKAGDSKPKSHVATVEVEIEVEVNDGFIDIVTIMTAPDRSLKAARELKNNWSEGQQRTEQAVNSPHPLTAEAANPEADSPDTRPVADSLPEPTEYSKRPKNWDKNYGSASKIAQAMGIALRGANGKMKKVPELVADIKAADAAVNTVDQDADLSKNQPNVNTSTELVQKPSESGQVSTPEKWNRLTYSEREAIAIKAGLNESLVAQVADRQWSGIGSPRGRLESAMNADSSSPTGEVDAAQAEWTRTRDVDRMAMMLKLGYSEEVARRTAGKSWENVGSVFKAKLAKAMAEPLTPVAPTAPTGEDALYTSTAKLTQPYTLDDFIGNVDAGYRAHFDYAGADGRTLWIERVEGGWVLKSKDDDSTTVFTKGGAGIGGRWSKGEALRAAEDDAKFRYTEWKPVVSQQEGMFQTPAEKAAIEGKPIKGTNRKERIDSILSNGGKVVDGTLRTSNGLSMFKLTDVEAAAVPATQKDTSEDIKRRLQEVYPASAAELSPITKARNFLMELEAKLEGQGRVVDDRLVQMIRQQKDVIKELEAEQGKAQDLPSQEASNTIQSSPSEDAITEAKATIESLDAQIKRHEELLGCLG